MIIKCPFCNNIDGYFVCMKDKDNIDIKSFSRNNLANPPKYLKCSKCEFVFDFELDESVVVRDE